MTVVARTTYRLEPQECELCGEAEAVALRNEYVGGDPTQALAIATDLVPHKARADVLVVGSAFLGANAASVMARVAVGAVDKTIEVFGERVFLQDGSIRPGAKLTRVPLGWDRAAGGPDTWNPVGVRLDRMDGLGRTVLPNLQPPGLYITERSQTIAPTGFGPISPRWPTRWKLWTVGGEPTVARFRDEALAEAVDRSFFNAAPIDQQLDAIRPQERIVLENLSPSHPVLMTALPAVRVRATFAGRDVPMLGDTLLIDTDRQLCFVTWRATLDDEPGTVQVSLERDGVPLDSAKPERAGPTFVDEATTDDPPTGREQASARPVRGRSDTLPFRRGAAGLPIEESRAPSWIKPSASAPPPAYAPSASPPAPVTSAPSFGPSPSAFPSPPAARAPAPVVPAVAAPPPVAAPGLVATPAVALSSAQLTGGGGVRSVGGAPIPPAYAPSLAKPVEPERASVSHAVAVGAEAASNAAASAEKRVATASAKEPSGAVGTLSNEPVDLIWLASKALPRVRIFYKGVLADVAFESFDSKHELASDDAEEDKGRHEVAGVLTREPAIDPAAVGRVIAEAVDERGRFTPPLAVIEGELRPRFSDVARLRAAVAIALASGDKRLADTASPASELLGRPHPNAGGAATRQLAALREQHLALFGKAATAASFDAEIERLLVDERTFEERTLFGEKQLVFALGSGASALPAYAPEAVRAVVPLFEVVRARVIAEVHARQDRAEGAPFALRLVALARVLDLATPQPYGGPSDRGNR